jgi:hypothetical protein
MASSEIGTGAPNFASGSHIRGTATDVSAGDVRASGEEPTCPQLSALENKNAHPIVMQRALMSAAIRDPDPARGG